MALYSQLYHSLLQCPLGSQQFLPLNVLDKITKESVQAELPLTVRIRRRSLPDKVVLGARKVFAILVLADNPLAITDLLKEGLTDEHLPLSRQGGDSSNILVSVCKKKTFRSFDVPRNEAKVTTFLDKQWAVLAPVLDTTGKYFILDQKCALPFPAVEEVGGGHSSTVYKSTLHPAHHHGFKAGEPGLEVAIKEFRAADPFTKEKENLEKIQHLHHKHLVEHLAICENGSRYYVIFPWADGGNLRQFWEFEDSRERTPELVLWSLQQMLGLAGALMSLHSVNCRHGDLKPENILHFKEGSHGNLVVADVGVSKVHEKPTEFRHAKTTTRATTPSYEPPEVYLQPNTPRARRYDLWSMGCIFLEFSIWLLYGFEAINSFGYARDAPDFGFYTLNSEKTAAETHRVVFKAINAVLEDPRCGEGTALGVLVKLIVDHLIQVEVERRYSADELYDELQKIVQVAQKNPEYLFSKADPRPDLPKLFQSRASIIR
ncbi:kinase-like protein [Stipitochalara longipes BDJ]|nr:kinase-like protein [Stipitochalara longipes BDJ]